MNLWRKGKSVIHTGKTTHFVPENNVYTYFRYNDTESVMVLLNNSDEKQEVNISRFRENTQNYSTGKDVINRCVFFDKIRNYDFRMVLFEYRSKGHFRIFVKIPKRMI